MYAYAVGRNTFELEILQIRFKYICVFSTSVYMIVQSCIEDVLEFDCVQLLCVTEQLPVFAMRRCCLCI